MPTTEFITISSKSKSANNNSCLSKSELSTILSNHAFTLLATQ